MPQLITVGGEGILSSGYLRGCPSDVSLVTSVSRDTKYLYLLKGYKYMRVTQTY